ncbi:MAG: tetratricopeptide repeat protein, partial [Gammaproteobacteria bacterium]|nr:tetratricopeptide repeat protein [Gammaproteobacteria bacterium]
MFANETKAPGCGRQLLIQTTGLILLWVLAPLAVYAHTDLQLQIEQLTAQMEQAPGNVELYLKRGNLLRRHGDWALARADFKRVRKIQPDNEIIDWFDGRLA